MAEAPPNSVAQLSHAITIRANSTTIGAINEWSPRMTQTVTELYEFGAVTSGGSAAGLSAKYSRRSGEPFEKVIGNVSGLEIGVKRYDIYTQQMEQAFFAEPVLHMLSDQRNAFDVVEKWITPNNINNYSDIYSGCWFSSLGRTLSATSDRIVNVDATLHYTRRDRLPL